MASWVERRWEASLDALRTRDRRSGSYRAYQPDFLLTRPLTIDPDLTTKAARVETAVRGLASGPGAHALEGMARFLLRSEAIASSRIEGLQVSAQQVALAELAQAEDGPVRGFSENARLVANNITALRRASTELAVAPALTVAGITDLHRALLPGHPGDGLRDVQNWIGGSDWHPLDAEFVPPPPQDVLPLMEDLAWYLTGAAHGPLVQAGLVHAQFETIHPFTDGNGRVGRALIHTVLTRRGLTSAALLPVSLVLLTRSEEYVGALTAYRYAGFPDSAAAQQAVSTWLRVFVEAVEVAAAQARSFAGSLTELRLEWQARHEAYRLRHGIRQRARADSAVARLLAALPDAPLVTARTVQRQLGVSFPAARAAVEQLAEARILSRKQVDRGTTGYLARDVFDLLTFAERRLASTRWDTRESAPRRPVPASPPAPI